MTDAEVVRITGEIFRRDDADLLQRLRRQLRRRNEAELALIWKTEGHDGGAAFLAVWTEGDPATVVRTVRTAVAEVDPAVLVQASGTTRTLAAAPLARPRLVAAIMGVYALVVVVLAVAGLYAVVAGSVAGRRREFGVRASLGATPRALASLLPATDAAAPIAVVPSDPASKR